MLTTARTLALAASAFLLAPLAHAALPNIGTLTCTGGGNGTLTEPLFALTFGTGTSNPRYFTAYVPLTDLNARLSDEYFGTAYAFCTLSTLPGLVTDSVIVVDATGNAVVAGVQTSFDELYASVIFSYTGLSIDLTTLKPLPAATPEQQAKSLQEYKARNFALPTK